MRLNQNSRRTHDLHPPGGIQYRQLQGCHGPLALNGVRSRLETGNYTEEGEVKNRTRTRDRSLCATVYYRFRIHGLGFDVRRVAFPFRVVATICRFSTALDQDVSLEMVSNLPRTAGRTKTKRTFRASFLEKLLSQCVQGNGLTAK